MLVLCLSEFWIDWVMFMVFVLRLCSGNFPVSSTIVCCMGVNQVQHMLSCEQLSQLGCAQQGAPGESMSQLWPRAESWVHLIRKSEAQLVSLHLWHGLHNCSARGRGQGSGEVQLAVRTADVVRVNIALQGECPRQTR
jgi:hypothetical protein